MVKKFSYGEYFIQNPQVTTIKCDLAMTWTSYGANTGDLLGLFLDLVGSLLSKDFAGCITVVDLH